MEISTSTSNCPICKDPSLCKAYPLLIKRLNGPDGHRWKHVHDKVNGFVVPPDLDDAARAAALIAEFPPESLSVPIGRKCCG